MEDQTKERERKPDIPGNRTSRVLDNHTWY